MNHVNLAKMDISAHESKGHSTGHSKFSLPEASAGEGDSSLEDVVHGPTANGAPKRDIFLTMATLCAGGILTSLDAVIVATSLPSMAEDLNATAIEYSWVGSS